MSPLTHDLRQTPGLVLSDHSDLVLNDVRSEDDNVIEIKHDDVDACARNDIG